ncbi:MAG: flagellar hook-associated protein FlgK [Anaerolineae bacterium]|jgi:flagellar hook-associated protein 1 FlgK|nr:MAG: flagellar hook-associated protein FlgK [Anaerolineae bacterium]
MSNILYGLNIALKAMLSQQIAIQVTEHNVANATTPGYRRQEAMMSADLPHIFPSLRANVVPGQLGMGVVVNRIRQYNLEFFDDRYRRALSESKGWQMQADLLKQVEATLAETSEDGLIPKLDAFWSGWQALSNDPTNTAIRSDLLERGAALAKAINWRAQALVRIQQDQNSLILQRVNEINSLASKIAALNVEIVAVKSAGSAPNDLMDQRDQLITRLAELSGATAAIQENGEALVSIGGHALVIGATTFKLATTSGYLASIYWEADGNAFTPSRGELAGLLQARDVIIPRMLSSLDALAQNLVTQVNTLHAAGYALDGSTTGLNFFDPTGVTALSIRLSTDVANQPERIAAAEQSASPADSNNAVALASLRERLVMNSNTETFNQYYTRQITQMGIDIQRAEAFARDRLEVAKSLETLKEAVVGVNLDEEAANLIKYQRAFQAATRMVTAMDEMLDKIINGMGVVGR